MRTRTLLLGALLTAVATACAARADAPIPASHLAALGEVGDPSADAVSAFEASAGRSDPELARRLDRLLAASEVGPAVWGVAIRALDRNERLYARNPDVLLTPASTMKVVTLAAVAERLGWDHRFETRLLTAAPIQDGTLWGDLVVRGAGDPTLDASGAEDAFVRWADELLRLGIRRIAEGGSSVTTTPSTTARSRRRASEADGPGTTSRGDSRRRPARCSTAGTWSRWSSRRAPRRAGRRACSSGRADPDSTCGARS